MGIHNILGMPITDWRPSPFRFPSGTFTCRILERIDHGAGYVKEDYRRPTMHYTHVSEQDAEECAWRQIAGLRKERDAARSAMPFDQEPATNAA